MSNHRAAIGIFLFFSSLTILLCLACSNRVKLADRYKNVQPAPDPALHRPRLATGSRSVRRGLAEIATTQSRGGTRTRIRKRGNGSPNRPSAVGGKPRGNEDGTDWADQQLSPNPVRHEEINRQVSSSASPGWGVNTQFTPCREEDRKSPPRPSCRSLRSRP
jgi:hypothetical protein